MSFFENVSDFFLTAQEKKQKQYNANLIKKREKAESEKELEEWIDKFQKQSAHLTQVIVSLDPQKQPEEFRKSMQLQRKYKKMLENFENVKTRSQFIEASMAVNKVNVSANNQIAAWYDQLRTNNKLLNLKKSQKLAKNLKEQLLIDESVSDEINKVYNTVFEEKDEETVPVTASTVSSSPLFPDSSAPSSSDSSTAGKDKLKAQHNEEEHTRMLMDLLDSVGDVMTPVPTTVAHS